MLTAGQHGNAHRMDWDMCIYSAGSVVAEYNASNRKWMNSKIILLWTKMQKSRNCTKCVSGNIHVDPHVHTIWNPEIMVQLELTSQSMFIK